MNSSDLTPEQAAVVAEQVRRSLRYLTTLRERMERQHFPPHDELLRLVIRAEDAIHRLWVDLHYRSCRDGVWRQGN
jgi:hypothetical protein